MNTDKSKKESRPKLFTKQLLPYDWRESEVKSWKARINAELAMGPMVPLQ